VCVSRLIKALHGRFESKNSNELELTKMRIYKVDARKGYGEQHEKTCLREVIFAYICARNGRKRLGSAMRKRTPDQSIVF